MTNHTDDLGRSGAQRKDLLAFDRSDRWGLIALLGLFAIVTVVSGVVHPVLRWVEGAPVPTEVFSPVVVPGLDAAGVEHGLGTYDLLVPVAGVGQRILSIVPGALVAGGVLLGCWLLLRVMRSIAGGDPFTPANVTRLRGLAGLLVFGSTVVFFLEMAVTGALLGTLDLGALEPGFRLDFPWWPLLSGMVVALLAEAFKAGSRLRDDVDGLV
ncbi:MAG TPA: DUF2975 domain-containing protein [Ornithinibacter sp.]|nr:DUF2975 domain-containing protein [Ornithinibacter sp.]